jgi:hypothetical protein
LKVHALRRIAANDTGGAWRVQAPVPECAIHLPASAKQKFASSLGTSVCGAVPDRTAFEPDVSFFFPL